MALLVDTGVLYALADKSDAWHQRVRDFLTGDPDTLLVPITVLPEIAYLLREHLSPSAERDFVRSLTARELDIEPLRDRDVDRAAELLDRYQDIGFVDATIVAMAERLKLKRLATTDRRHFAQVKPAHTTAFDLLP